METLPKLANSKPDYGTRLRKKLEAKTKENKRKQKKNVERTGGASVAEVVVVGAVVAAVVVGAVAAAEAEAADHRRRDGDPQQRAEDDEADDGADRGDQRRRVVDVEEAARLLQRLHRVAAGQRVHDLGHRFQRHRIGPFFFSFALLFFCKQSCRSFFFFFFFFLVWVWGCFWEFFLGFFFLRLLLLWLGSEVWRGCAATAGFGGPTTGLKYSSTVP